VGAPSLSRGSASLSSCKPMLRFAIDAHDSFPCCVPIAETGSPRGALFSPGPAARKKSSSYFASTQFLRTSSVECPRRNDLPAEEQWSLGRTASGTPIVESEELDGAQKKLAIMNTARRVTRICWRKRCDPPSRRCLRGSLARPGGIPRGPQAGSRNLRPRKKAQQATKRENAQGLRGTRVAWHCAPLISIAHRGL